MANLGRQKRATTSRSAESAGTGKVVSGRQTRSLGSTRPVRVGVVGCGNVMDGAYMPLLRKLQFKGVAEIVGASHTSRSGCQNILKKWSITRYFSSYQELCQSPQVDLVVVLTSMERHAEIARNALLAGKHVLVEKPMATSIDEGQELLVTANRKGKYLVCAPFVTLSPTFRIIRKRVRAGAIGKVCLARARYGWSGPDWADWFYRPGAGPIFDLAVYSITSLTGILGAAKRVMAMTGIAQPVRRVRGKRIKVEVEDSVQILLDFGGSVSAVITSGFTMQKYRCPAIELYGTDGTIQMLGDDWAPEGYELWQNSIAAWQSYYETDPHWQWTSGLEHLIDCIRTRRRPEVEPEHAFHVLEVMLAAQKAGRTGCAEQIKSSFSHSESEDGDVEPGVGHRIHDRRRE